jgi:hypothetical protein
MAWQGGTAQTIYKGGTNHQTGMTAQLSRQRAYRMPPGVALRMVTRLFTMNVIPQSGHECIQPNSNREA